jgi:opacity protein-like surface antigen
MNHTNAREQRKFSRLFRAACLVTLALWIVLPTFAGELERKWPLGIGVGLAGGYAKPSNELYSGGTALGFCVSIGFMEYLAVEITGQCFEPKVEASDEGLSKGKLSILPIQLSLQGRYPLSGGRLMPYLELGAGYYLNNFAVDGDLAGNWERVGFTLEEKVKSAMGFHFGAGLDFYVIRNLSLGLGFKYCLAKMKGSWSLTDIASSTEVSGDLSGLKLDPIMFGLRVRYIFK